MARIDGGDDMLQADTLRAERRLQPFGRLLLELAGRLPAGAMNDPADRADLTLDPPHELPDGRAVGKVAGFVAGGYPGSTELR